MNLTNNNITNPTNITKNSDKWVYSGYRIAFDGASPRNFGNYFGRNILIFGVDQSQ